MVLTFTNKNDKKYFKRYKFHLDIIKSQGTKYG